MQKIQIQNNTILLDKDKKFYIKLQSLTGELRFQLSLEELKNELEGSYE